LTSSEVAPIVRTGSRDEYGGYSADKSDEAGKATEYAAGGANGTAWRACAWRVLMRCVARGREHVPVTVFVLKEEQRVQTRRLPGFHAYVAPFAGADMPKRSDVHRRSRGKPFFNLVPQ